MLNVCEMNSDYSVVPFASIVFHKCDDHVIVTKHDIKIQNKRPSIRPGQMISSADVHMLLSTISEPDKNELRLNYHSRHIIASGYNTCLWFSPPKTAPMWFSGKQKSFKTVYWPGLIFLAIDGELYVYAVKNVITVSPKTMLYNAPLMNLYHDGRLCMGNIQAPNTTHPHQLIDWEAAIYNTAFTHVNHQQTIQSKREVSTTTLYRFWRSLQVKKKPTPFPYQKLVSTGLTIESLLMRVNRKYA